MNFRSHILPLAELPVWRQARLEAGKRLVVTNGCFDLLHAGHIDYLDAARQLGDLLLVGLNADASVRQLKGQGRPLQPEADRATILAALRMVDAVCIFPEITAAKFLIAARPDVYVKGGDYTLESLDPDERQAVEKSGGRIMILPFLAGRSTAQLVRQMGAANGPGQA